MKTLSKPLAGFARRLPTATLNGLTLRGKHENYPLAWKVLATRLAAEAVAEEIEEAGSFLPGEDGSEIRCWNCRSRTSDLGFEDGTCNECCGQAN